MRKLDDFMEKVTKPKNRPGLEKPGVDRSYPLKTCIWRLSALSCAVNWKLLQAVLEE
jgi:hypothetical protein